MFFSLWSVKPIERFLNNHPEILERAFGYTLGVGIRKELTPCAIAAFKEQLGTLLKSQSTRDAWEEYKNTCSAPPTEPCCPWPALEGRVSFVLRHEILADYVLPRTEPRPETRYWDRVDHIARFILRVAFHRLQQEKEALKQPADVHTWTHEEYWTAAYVLYELVQGLQGPRPSLPTPEFEEELYGIEHDGLDRVGLRCKNARASWNLLRRLL